MKTLSKGARAMALPLPHHRFTVEAYDEMVAHGILTSDDRVELLAGEIVDMSPIGSRHAACVYLINEFFRDALRGRAIVRGQSPLALSADSEPEPDLAVVHSSEDAYSRAHPRAAETFTLIEVADSSLERDRMAKLPLYAAAGIPEVWIVNLRTNTVERYTEPRANAYAVSQTYRGDEAVPLGAFADITLRVAQIIPK